MKFKPAALKELIEREKLTQGELADKLGLSRVYVNQVLNGKMAPGTKFAFAVLDAFPHYNIDYLYSRD